MLEQITPHEADEYRRGCVDWVDVVREDIGVGQVRDLDHGTLHTFCFNAIEGYRGEYPKEIGLRSGRIVDYIADEYGVVDYLKFQFVDERPKLFGKWSLPFKWPF